MHALCLVFSLTCTELKLLSFSHRLSVKSISDICPFLLVKVSNYQLLNKYRWILRTDYLDASNQAGKFLDEEPYEWHRNGLSEDGTINLEAPRRWRLLRERTGHGAFYDMRIIIYGECIAPSLVCSAILF